MIHINVSSIFVSHCFFHRRIVPLPPSLPHPQNIPPSCISCPQDIQNTGRLIQYYRVPLLAVYARYARNRNADTANSNPNSKTAIATNSASVACLSYGDFALFVADAKFKLPAAAVFLLYAHAAHARGSFLHFGDFVDVLLYVAEFQFANGDESSSDGDSGSDSANVSRLCARFERLCTRHVFAHCVPPPSSASSSTATASVASRPKPAPNVLPSFRHRMLRHGSNEARRKMSTNNDDIF